MPTPLYPKKDESKEDYLSRCISAVKGEGKTQSQAIGQCYGQWREGKGKKDLINEGLTEKLEKGK